jgi:predicted nucleic acid-binding protein
MQDYFVDTWYLVAGLDRFDLHHPHARRLEATLKRTPLITHDAVLTELLAYFSGQGANSRLQAARAVRNVAMRMNVIPGSRDLFLRALSLYEHRPDKEYSLVDCMSMTLMRERGITHVLTNDHHFRQEGFTVVNE